MNKAWMGLMGMACGLLSMTELKGGGASLESRFRRITPQEISGNIIKMVGDDWTLISAGDSREKFNTMTASWGGLGSMWGKAVAFVLVRNERHTFQFMENSKYFTLTFYEEKYRPQLKMFGTKSGRDTDKVKESGFTVVDTGFGMAYMEASLIICCKKIYGAKMAEENAIPELSKEWYFNGSKDYHKLYFGEIMAVWKKK